jgi:flagellar biosynthesis protein FlhG
MSDQAESLRRIVDDLRIRNQAAVKVDMPVKRARVITVTSGKGGVGKTNMTVNMAIAMSQLGLRVVILDVDFGLANIDVLFGIVPKYSLVDLIRDERSIFEVLADGPNNIKFLSGGSGVEELVRLDRNQLRKFVSSISLLDKLYDVILIDTGAGLNQNVMSFILAADEVVLVTTPEPTAMTDAYALVKMVAKRDKRKQIRLLVNKADSAREAEDVLSKLSAVSEKFLSLKLEKLGYILYDDAVTKAVRQQKPFLLGNARSVASKQLVKITEVLVSSNPDKEMSEPAGAKGFIQKLLSIFNA